MTMEPGSKLASYTIVEKLADSDVGEVYVAKELAADQAEGQADGLEATQAQDAKPGGEVVLKVLRPGLAEDVRRITKFKIKTAAVSKLQHRNIVPILAMEKAGGVQFIATPKIDGRPLDQVIGGTGLLLDRIFKLAIPLTDAVALAHDADVIHGGLKPSNVMLGNDGRLRVVDFAMNVLHSDLGPQLAAGVDGDVRVEDPVDSLGDQRQTPWGGLAGSTPEEPTAAQSDLSFLEETIETAGVESPPPALEGSSRKGADILLGIEDLPPPKKSAARRGSHGMVEILDDSMDFGVSGSVKERLAPGSERRVADAEAQEGDPAELDELSPEEARILEVVSHMAPEQIEGATPDTRSDIFSLGVLMYRMATGHPAFPGVDRSAVAMAVLEESPAPISDVNPGLPRHLGRIIGRCLEKDPDRRYQSARDLHNELLGLKAEVATGGPVLMAGAGAANGVAEAQAGGRRQAASDRRAGVNGKAARQPVAGQAASALGGVSAPTTGWGFVSDWRFWTVAAAVLVVALVGGFVMGSIGGGSTDREGSMMWTRLTLDAGGLKLDPILSSSGDEFLYASPSDGDWDLYFQVIGTPSPVNLTSDSEVNDTQPALSPDGRRIAFRSERDGGGIFLIDRMAAAGEPLQKIIERGYNPAWSPTGNAVVVATEGVLESPFRREMLSDLWLVDLAAGESRILMAGDAVQPAWSPNGNRIAYWAIERSTGQADIWTVAADGSDPLQVTTDAGTDWSPAWSPDGQYLYFASDRSGNMDLWRVSIDEGSGSVRGLPEPVTSAGTVWSTHPSFARDVPGRMVYVESRRQSKIRGVPFNSSRGTAGENPVTVLDGTRDVLMPDPSPDGRSIAFVGRQGQQQDIWVVQTDGSGLRPLTDDAARDRLPRWSPDGRRITFVSNRSGSDQIWSIRPDGSDLRQVTDAGGRDVSNATWSPNGAQLCLNTTGDLVADLNFLINPSVAPDQQTLGGIPPMMGGETFEANSWSPDSSRLAGTLRTANGAAVGIGLYALQPQEYEQITQYGSHPAWLRDSRRLLFQHRGRILLVDRRTRDVREVYSPGPDEMAEYFSVSRDNQRIYVTVKTTDSTLVMVDSGAAGGGR
jgi:Tol biopolymer transport system component/serine/threonine protein kinase